MLVKVPPLLSRMSVDHTPFCLKNQGLDPIEMAFLPHRGAKYTALGDEGPCDTAILPMMTARCHGFIAKLKRRLL
jgi:hypothetical protein